jgi:alpha-amylase/alpha-mannosidase (GH57 family)
LKPAAPVQVVILWHMHQPPYRDPLDARVVLPWVRLHALKDYVGMVRVLEETPSVKATFNLVPSLLDQVEAYAAGHVDEVRQHLATRPAAELGEEERRLALRQLFQAHHRLIDSHPRYRQLLEQRGPSAADHDLAQAARRFSVDDFRDLQLLSTLAWFDLDRQRSDPELRALVGKGRGYDEQDKLHLARLERALLAEVVPAYRAAAARGQIEISTSPYYHPILPLLCDTEAHHESHPGAPLPPRFRHPEDALDQIERARAAHAARFGRPPEGLWPSEGSVSEAALQEMARAGVRWAASDEGVLERTLGQPLRRDEGGVVHPLDVLYRPWVRRTAAGPVSLLFRDRALSDLIGFVYTNQDPEASAADLLARLRRVGDAWEQARLPGAPVVPLILDGENAWEYYRDGGRVFLRRLYQGLAEDPRLRAVTASEAVAAAPRRELPRLHAGSWIHADFNVWIGHADDRRAWELLGEARQALERARARVSPESFEYARECFRAACASDWFWWYGDDRTSDNDFEFDRLFRRHLQAVYRAVGEEPPAALEATLITTRSFAPAHTPPAGPVVPLVDGEATDADGWAAAAASTVALAGAMGRGGHGLRAVRFGAGQGGLQVLVEMTAPARQALAHAELELAFREPAGVRYRLALDGARLAVRRDRRGPEGWLPEATAARAAAATVVEISIPLAELVHDGARAVAFQVVTREGGLERERHPEAVPLTLDVAEARG